MTFALIQRFVSKDDLVTGGALRIEKEDLKNVQGLTKSYLKFYATFANLLSSQREYTIFVYKYMLSLGTIDKGDCLCSNMDQHSGY